MRSSTLAAVGLLAGGVALGVVGWRMRDAELQTARLHQVEVAQRDAEAAATGVAASLATDPLGTLTDALGRLSGDESGSRAVEWWSGPSASAPDALADEERLLVDEADYRQRAHDDYDGAVAIYRRLRAEWGEARDRPRPRTWSLRIGVLEARAGRLDAARADLEEALGGSSDPPTPEGTSVGAEALYELARMDAPQGRFDRLDAFLDTVGPSSALADGDVRRIDLLFALEVELRGVSLPETTAAKLRDATTQVRRALAWRERLRDARVAVVGREIGLRVEVPASSSFGDLLAIAPVSNLDRVASWGRGSASRLRVVPAGTEAGVARARIAPPLDALEVVATLDEPPTAGTVGTVALAGALLVYALGAAFAWGAIRRSQRTAAMQADFVASVSHEMKTPVAAVQAMAEMLADGRVPSKEREREYAQRIEAEMRRLGTTVKNVLDAARIERGMDGVVRPRATEPGEVVAHLVEAVRPSLEARGFRVGLEVVPAPHPIPVDPDALTSVVANLVDNAAKFSRETKEIEVAAAPKGETYRIEVLDRGPGVPASDRERVFERFQRGAAAKEDAVPGVGLGLHVARSLVEAHGGALRVEDREGGGARFVVTLRDGARNGRST
jgi:signal transduction histidine kinase